MMSASNGLILIVDDEPDMVSTIAGLMKDLGFDTLEASNGLQAMDMYCEHQMEISLILCDISMPQMDGLEFFKRGLAKFGAMPIVMVTAHADIPRVTDAMRLGAIDYLVKPFNTQNLEKQVYIWQEIARRHLESASKSRLLQMEGLLRIQNSEVKKIKLAN
jgi:DNA-binding NtrC family response regulator